MQQRWQPLSENWAYRERQQYRGFVMAEPQRWNRFKLYIHPFFRCTLAQKISPTGFFIGDLICLCSISAIDLKLICLVELVYLPSEQWITYCISKNEAAALNWIEKSCLCEKPECGFVLRLLVSHRESFYLLDELSMGLYSLVSITLFVLLMTNAWLRWNQNSLLIALMLCLSLSVYTLRTDKNTSSFWDGWMQSVSAGQYDQKLITVSRRFSKL